RFSRDWSSDVCSSDLIREARVKGNNLRFKMQKSNEEKIFTAYFLQIQDVEYKKIRLIYNPLSEDVIINPSEYEEYNQQFLQADRSEERRVGKECRTQG